MRLSPGNSSSRPPLKKKVTCAYFSVSAMRSCVRPRLRHDLAERLVADPRAGTASARQLVELGRILQSCRARRRSARVCCRAKPAKPGSSSAVRISRTRSARKFAHQHAVAVLHAAIVADHRRRHELVALAARIGCARSRACASGACVALGRDERAIGLLDPVPALVAVHARNSARRRWRCATRLAAPCRRLNFARKPSALLGGVSRPSRKAWHRDRNARLRRARRASAAMWS